ncbi:MAG: hypothetical protein OWS74_08810, partial [Firmicutes bacterium]|nr:hypothetical protein [Bacillota bacterium]
VAQVHDLLHYMRYVKKRIDKLERPVCILQGKQDRTVHPSSALYWMYRVQSAYRVVQFFPQSGHLLPLDSEREQVWQAVQDFLSGPANDFSRSLDGNRSLK